MKTLTQYIDEAFRINKDTKVKQEYNYHPKSRKELRELIIKLIKERGNNADLNDIDVSEITDMSRLFSGLGIHNIDISEWDVSNVKDMMGMFYACKDFNCDLFSWNVINVINMKGMFCDCENFNCDLSKWNVSNVKDMQAMFYDCDNLQKTPNWYYEE